MLLERIGTGVKYLCITTVRLLETFVVIGVFGGLCYLFRYLMMDGLEKPLATVSLGDILMALFGLLLELHWLVIGGALLWMVWRTADEGPAQINWDERQKWEKEKQRWLARHKEQAG